MSELIAGKLQATLLVDAAIHVNRLDAQIMTSDEALSSSTTKFLISPLVVPANHISHVECQMLVNPHPYPWMTEEVVFAAYCWKIERLDGVVMGFTSHDQDLTFGGVTYEATTGFSPTEIDTNDSLAVDNLDVDAALTSDRITEEDLSGGVYDYAKITVYLVNWMNLNDPKKILRRGTLGRVTYSKTKFTAELRGLTEAFQQQNGPVYQKVCRAVFGDEKCKMSLADKTFTGTVTDVTDDSNFKSDLSKSNGYFEYGVLTWTSGANKDESCEVKTYKSTGNFALYIPSTQEISIGDTFKVSAGCDHNLSTCVAWGNWVNFRGEPYLPGTDYISSYPVKGSGNVANSVSEARRG